MEIGSPSDAARILYARLMLFGVAFVVCGSLAPFHFQAIPSDEVVDRFARTLLLNAGINSRSDFLANVLLMMPVAFCAAGAARRASTIGGRIAVVLTISLCGAAVSLSMEFLQTFLPTRVVSLRDVIAETSGSLLGALGFLWFGRALSAAVSRWAQRRHQLSTAEVWLLGYTVLLALWQLMPLDLSLSPAEIFHKYSEGRLITGLTFAGPKGAGFALEEAAAAILIYMPVGVAAALLWRPRGHRRALAIAVTLGLLAVGVIQGSRLFVESRSLDLQTLVSGAVGAALGAALVSCMLAGLPAARIPQAFGPALTGIGWMALIVGSQWYPFNFVSNGAEALARLQKLTLSPVFAADNGRTLAVVAGTFLMTLPLGVCLRRVLGPEARVGAGVVVGLAMVAAGLWSGIELGVALLPARVPDPIHVPVAACGAAAGLWLGGMLMTHSFVSRRVAG